MKFKAEKTELVLELESAEGEKKNYPFRGKVSAKECDKVLHEWQMYEKAQESLPAEERDSQVVLYAKELKMAFPELDTDWLLDNFVLSNLAEMITSTAESISGVKKKE